MFAIADDRRRAGTKPSAVPREVPVLFHLHDVASRQRAALQPPRQAEIPADAPPAPQPAEVAAAQLVNSVTALHVAESATVDSVASSTQSTPLDLASAPVSLATPSQSPAESVTSVAPDSHSPDGYASIDCDTHSATECLGPSAPTHTPSGKSPTDEAGPDAAIEASIETQPLMEEAATPRAAPARRPRKTPASEDWFATHGKYIALGFGLALVATIYLARSTRQAGPAGLAQTPLTPLAEEPAVVVPSPAAATIARTATSSSATTDADAGKVAASSTTTTISEPKANLQPPAVSQLASQPVTDSGKTDKDRLFEFAAPQKTEERVATRTDTGSRPAAAPQGSAPPLGAAPPLTSVPPLAPPMNQPVTGPVYPTTASPQPIYPVSATPPNRNFGGPTPPAAVNPGQPYLPGAYTAAAPPPSMPPAGAPPTGGPQAAGTRSQFPAAPAPYAPGATNWNQAPAGTAGPAPNHPPYNTASGRRYEPTGSGNY